MKETIITLLWLQSYSQDKKIAKNIFYAQDDFSKHAEKLFTKQVDTISLIAVLNTNNTNIESYITEEELYAELLVISVVIRDTTSVDKISTIIHQIIPNPLLLIIHYESQAMLTISHKRKNKADKSKQVVEQIYHTDWISWDTDLPFWSDMHYTSHVFTNLKRFYEWWLYPIIIMQYQRLWWWYRSIQLDMMPQVLDTITHYQTLQRQIEPLEYEYKNTLSLGEQTKLYMQIKKLKEQQKNLLQSL